MKKFSFFLPLLFLSLLYFSCKKDNGNDNQAPAYTAMNVAYGNDAKQKMDIYLPANRSQNSTKSFIFIHGGGWQEGDKSDFNQFLDTFKILFPDYAFFNINYRLYSSATQANQFPTQETDVKSAVDFINSNIATYIISDKYVLLGASAGGHLALLQGYKYDNPKIKAIINFFGVADMNAMYNNPASPLAPPAAVAAVMGGTPTSLPQLYFSSSPINYVNAGDPPTISFQGGVDPVVSPSQQTALKTKLDANGIVNQYVLYPNESHGWVGANLTDSYLKIKAFVQANVQ